MDKPAEAAQHTQPPKEDQRKTVYGKYRLVTLVAAFLVILINPFLNFYLHWDFVQGWYQSLGIGDLWFVSPLEGLESILIARAIHVPAVVGMLIPLVVAYLLGRVFCSWVCPVSFILELFDRFRRFVSGRQFLRNKLIVAKRVLWFTLIAELLCSMILGAPLFVFLSPPGLVGREIMMLVFFKSIALEGILLILIIFLELVTRRFYCRSFCPLGSLLALVGSNRRLQVSQHRDNCTSCGKCAKTCPMGLEPATGEGATPYCWNCGECVDSCRFSALEFRWMNR